jgi:hypothetical protein
MSYADSLISNKVLFHYGLVGADNTFGGNLPAGNVTVPGNTTVAPNGQYGTGIALGQTVARGTSETGVPANEDRFRGSAYTAVGALANGRPLVAWYDGRGQQLVFSYGNGTPTGNYLRVPSATNTNNTIVNSRYYTMAAGHGFVVGDPVTIIFEGTAVTGYVVRDITGNNIKFATSATATQANAFYAQNTTNIEVYKTIDYNNNPVATTPVQWQTNARVIPGTEAKGSHVDMAVDGGGNVHLAYYDVINGGLWYSYIPSASVISTSTAGIETVRVDTYLAAGTKLMLNVRQQGANYVPYISYFHGSFGETRNPIRIAWRSDFTALRHGTNETDDSFTGAWEVMTVPAANTPLIGEFVCNGVPTTGTLDGTGTDITYTDAVHSILVGYMTETRYEGAILKKNLW